MTFSIATLFAVSMLLVGLLVLTLCVLVSLIEAVAALEEKVELLERELGER